MGFTCRLKIRKCEVADTTEQIKFTNKLQHGQDFVMLTVTLIKVVLAAVAT
jgi:hypothetical protein